ncbi:GGDEF domain-containing protein [Qaidamihabitans albus]|uniref:GGDEF domain-containing protein n=1 Tax=Qaidamihabitans albus TaxID=2795733 RepID=UPI0027DE58C7|nr:GGDEF domain-containing protein [Qaidamihabitans albus]
MHKLIAGPRRWVAGWGLWNAPAPVRRYLLVVNAVAIVTSVATAFLVPVHTVDLVRFAVLAVCAAASIELTRQIERQREYLRHESVAYVDTKGLWSFAAVLVLPPVLATAMVVATYAMAWYRIWPSQRPVVPHRWIFACATVLIGSHAAVAVLAQGMHHYPGLPDPALPAGLADLGVVVLAAGLRWLLNCGLVMAAIALSDPQRPARDLFTNFSQQLLEAGAMGLGLIAATVLLTHPVVLAAIVPTLVIMHRGVLIHQYQNASRTDAKTGLTTVKWWRPVAEKAFGRAHSTGQAAGLLILDIDHFKNVNDTHGHLAGDEVLKAVAHELADEIRSQDACCRWGGEELTVVIPEVGDSTNLLRIAERVRRRVEHLAVDIAGVPGEPVRVTVSIGAAVYPDPGISTLDELMMAADSAVYAAKAGGRNQVRLAPTSTSSTTPA